MSLTFRFHQPEKQLYYQTSLVTSGQKSIEFQGQGKAFATLRFTNESGQTFYWSIGAEIANKIIYAADLAMDGRRTSFENYQGDNRMALFFVRRGDIQIDVFGSDEETEFFAEMSFDVGLWQPFTEVIRAHFQSNESGDPEPESLDLWREVVKDLDWD